MNKYSKILVICMTLVVQSCATYTTKYRVENYSKKLPNAAIDKTFYLIGDAGNAEENYTTDGLTLLEKLTDTITSDNNYLLFLGDNIYPKGLPKKKSKDRVSAQYKLDAQIKKVEKFKGTSIFIPGNHDWYSQGIKGVKRQENYITKRLGKRSFLPEKGMLVKQ